MKKLAAVKRALPFVLLAAIFVALLLFPAEKEGRAEERRVVTVWNVDTFEGGKGSRTAFLGRAARLAERGNAGVYYYVVAMSAEGALAALNNGEKPDILSFGLGLGEAAACGKPLSRTFAGGETAEGCLALPWCGGGYYLFSHTEEFDAAGKTAISCGGCNLPGVAAALGGISGEELPAMDAYVGFLGGKYQYLLGTQRDICRFEARGEAVYSRPLDEFCDIYQYVAVLSEDGAGDCEAFLAALFSDEMREKLGDIGMTAPDKTGAKATPSVFLSEAARAELAGAARAGDEKIVRNFLKKI